MNVWPANPGLLDEYAISDACRAALGGARTTSTSARPATKLATWADHVGSCSTETNWCTRDARNTVDPPEPYSKARVVELMRACSARSASNVIHGRPSSSPDRPWVATQPRKSR